MPLRKNGAHLSVSRRATGCKNRRQEQRSARVHALRLCGTLAHERRAARSRTCSDRPDRCAEAADRRWECEEEGEEPRHRV
eukprot:scaffold174438_cov32-Tisochrysis_lutea.AAC.1